MLKIILALLLVTTLATGALAYKHLRNEDYLDSMVKVDTSNIEGLGNTEPVNFNRPIEEIDIESEEEVNEEMNNIDAELNAIVNTNIDVKDL